MALNTVQFEELCLALVDAFTIETFGQMLNIKLEKKLSTIAVGNLTELVFGVVKRAEGEGWTWQLVVGSQAFVPGNPKLNAFIVAYPAYDPGNQPPTPANPYEATLLTGYRVFLGRKTFRDNLEKLGVPPESRVLQVTGPPQTGKTYSRNFVSYILETARALPGVRQKWKYFDLDEKSANVHDLASALADQLGLTVTLPIGESNGRLAQVLVKSLLAGIEHPLSPVEVWWLVLDGFRERTPGPGSRDFVEGLVKAADEETTKLRIVLVNYSLPDDLASYVLAEEIDKDPVTRLDIEKFVEYVYRRNRKIPTPQLVTQRVNDILTQVAGKIGKAPNSNAKRLETLSKALTETAKRLSA